jgi:hypothetical protein
MPKPKTSTLIYKKLVKWFVKVVWPWIVENIWPVLQEKIIEIFIKVATAFEGRLEEWLENRNRTKADIAQKKAEEAKAMSNSASSDAEAEKQRAIAEVWRQVAEQLRQENATLKIEFDEVTRKSAADFRSALESLEVENLIEEGEDTLLRLQGSQTALRLPSPTSQKE